MAEAVMEILLKIKLIKRVYVTNETLETGKILYCSDTLEAFFDENTRTRICLGKTSSVNTISELASPTEKDIGSFKIIIDTLSMMYCDSSLKWSKVKTRDEMVKILGAPGTFEPHNLIKNGKLIAPRTLASCVYDDYGVPIGESLNYLEDTINKLLATGISADMITSGTISAERIPKEARMDFRPVKRTKERLALTIEDIQNGDVVQETDNGRMYFVIDDSKLGTEKAFTEFTVGALPWTAILNKPLSITLKNGATGTVMLTTSSTTESQKLSMSVNLNLDYVDNGILSITHGGTGNQTGTAQFVDFETTDLEEIGLAGFRSNNKLAQSGSAKLKAGILMTPGFKATDDNTQSVIDNLHSDKVVLDKPNGEKSIIAYNDSKKNYYNLIKYADNSKLVLGETSIPFINIYGVNSIVSGTNIAALQVGTGSVVNASAKLTKTLFETSVSAKIRDNIIISGSNNDYPTKIAINQTIKNNSLIAAISTSTYTPKITTVEETINQCTTFENPEGRFSFGKSGDSTPLLCINTSEISISKPIQINGNATISGDMFISGTIYGTCSQATNSDTLDGHHATEFMKANGSNNTNPPVVIQNAAPTGRTNCIWINSSTGVANYWTGIKWTPISNA